MGLISVAVPLRDISDVDAFVVAAIHRSRLLLTIDERDELEAEGILILFEMGEQWDGRGTFIGYAYQWLPERLKSACRKMRGDVRRSAGGVRRWESPMVSLDELMAA